MSIKNSTKENEEKLKHQIAELEEKLKIAESRKGNLWTWARNYFIGTDVKDLSKKNERKNKFNNTFIGVLIGVGVGVPITFYCLNYAEGNYEFVIYSFLIAILSIGIFLFIFVTAKKSILRNTFDVEEASYKSITENLFNAVNEIVPVSNTSINKALPHAKEASKQIAAYISYSSTRRTLFGLLIGLIAGYAGYLGTMLIIQQNKLMKEQTHLAEASRRSSLIFLMSNIMDKIDDELKNDYQKDNIRNISPETIGRIASLSHALKPYKYLENNELIEKPLSPERGQLLLSLVNSNLDSITYNKIFSTSIFQDSDLRNVVIKDVSLNNINLSNSNLSNSKFVNCDISHSNLRFIYGNHTYFINCNFSFADLRDVSLGECILCGVKLYFTNLTESSFVNVSFAIRSGYSLPSNRKEIKLLENNIDKFIDFKYSCDTPLINYSIFHKADLTGTSFGNIDLIGCDFSQADLSYSIFSTGKIDSIDLRGASLNGLEINAGEWWVETLDTFGIYGMDEVKRNYSFETRQSYLDSNSYEVKTTLTKKK